MFSGIVSAVGKVAQLPEGLPGRLVLSHPGGWGGLQTGASVAVNGCCLTAVGSASDRVEVEVVPQTVRLTNLGRLVEGDPVNLEASLKLGDPVGGHLLTGHVDGTGRVLEIRPDANSVTLKLGVPAAVARYCVPQGSLAVDGCSLTLVEVDDLPTGGGEVTVCLIPHTLAQTVAAGYRVGTEVNLEADHLAKLVERLASPLLGERRER